MNTKPKIVVLGAGYAGLMTTKKLTQNLLPEEAEIVLVNKHNYHYETTWLHEVAAGTINPNQARYMISDAVNPNRVRLIRSEEHTSELQSRGHLVCRLLLEKTKNRTSARLNS